MKTVLFVMTVFFIHVTTYARTSAPHFNKVVYVVFENQDFSTVQEQKDFAAIAAKGAMLSNFIGEVHPSQGNYIAMIAGSDFGIDSDGLVDLPDRHVGDLLESNSKDWKVYAEGYPGDCFTGEQSGDYVRKHNPFVSFTNVSRDPKRCAKIVSDANFDSDLTSGALPAFSMYIPNLQNDGHDTDVDFAGNWLTQRFGSLLSHPENLKDVLFVITFDESGSLFSNHTFTLLIGANIKQGTTVDTTLNHVSLLRMVEDELALGNLGKDDVSATQVTGVWQ